MKPLKGPHSKCRLLAKLKIRRCPVVINTLAYNIAMLLTVEKSFLVQAPGVSAVKLFKSAAISFSARLLQVFSD